MTVPQTSDIDLALGRRRATLGVGLVVAAAIGLGAFSMIAHRQFVFTDLARTLMIVLVGMLAFRGRRWAAWAFGFFALAGAVAGIIGLAGTKFNAVGFVLFAPVIVANLAGFALLYLSGPSRAFLRRQQSMAPRFFPTPPAAPPAPPPDGR
ncbi:MAG TPA: hypothetical protein VG432_08325 [Gemmatimonadaceae bacterium]|nr:hypothetical protein [Gemmatimonadaceae bacterium]